MKKALVYTCLILLGIGIVSVFWQQELVYSLPTPVPPGFKAIEVGQDLPLVFSEKKHNKPVFVHFFNPACPCSRFNMKHFKTLVYNYGSQVDFMMIVQTQDKDISAEQVKDKFDVDIPCIMDPDEKIAKSCGVYSTPQAVIVDIAGKLYYRGNYNKARYCTDKRSDYARIALDSLLKESDKPSFTALATVPYGCSLPSCKNTIK